VSRPEWSGIRELTIILVLAAWPVMVPITLKQSHGQMATPLTSWPTRTTRNR